MAKKTPKWRQHPRVQRILRSRPFYLGKRLYERYLEDDVGGLAAEATYYLILAMVPFLVFVVNVLLFFAAAQLDTVIAYLQYLPGEAPTTLTPIVEQIVAGRSRAVLSVGLLFALWSSSKGMDTLIRATDQAFGTQKNSQSWFVVKLKSVLFTLMIVGTMLASLGLTVFGNALVKFVSRIFFIDKGLLLLWQVATYFIPFVAMVIAIAVFYRYAPRFVAHEGRTPWRYTLTSAGIVTTLWLIMTAGYGYYVGNIANMGATYGSLVGLMILFIWLNFTSVILVMGAEFIAAFDDMKLYFATPRRRDYQTDTMRIV